MVYDGTYVMHTEGCPAYHMAGHSEVSNRFDFTDMHPAMMRLEFEYFGILAMAFALALGVQLMFSRPVKDA